MIVSETEPKNNFIFVCWASKGSYKIFGLEVLYLENFLPFREVQRVADQMTEDEDGDIKKQIQFVQVSQFFSNNKLFYIDRV